MSEPTSPTAIQNAPAQPGARRRGMHQLALPLLASLLVFGAGCNDVNQTVTATSYPAAVVAPSVTGEPAFTWTTDDPNVPWGPCPGWMPEGCELAVIQGEAEQPNADVFFKMAPGTTVAEHWHTSAERMVLLSGELEVDYVGQDPVTMTAGIYAYGPAKLPHTTRCLGEEGDHDCILFIVFEEPVDAIPGQPDEIPDREAFTRTADGSNGLVWNECPGFFPDGCGLAILQSGDENGYNADALLRLQPNTTVPKHWHTSAERMVLVAGEFRVNYQGQPPVTLGPFTYAYGPAKLPHDARCVGQSECILFIAFEEPIDAVDIRGGNLPHRR